MASRLFQPERHEPLAETPWDADAAHSAVERIVADTRAAVGPDGAWPTHPADLPEGAPAFGGLYMGAEGVIWALDHLAGRGVGPTDSFMAGRLGDLADANRTIVARFSPQTRGYLIGDAGGLLLRHRLDPTDEIADALAAVIEANADDPSRDLMWGAPGTMLAALHMHVRTGEGRWAELFASGAAALERRLIFLDEAKCELWIQDLYGRQVAYLGAAHGFAGVAFVLWQGRRLLPAETWSAWRRRIARTLAATALREGGLANWPTTAPPEPPPLVQICHGAPGVVALLAGVGEENDALLLAGGELIWTAGPLTKGANLCHGTAGNGYALLKLSERTGDALWLDRARAFAMHAIAQSEAEAASLGRRRYSLWTGDLGLAVFLLDCIEGGARFPTLDVF